MPPKKKSQKHNSKRATSSSSSKSKQRQSSSGPRLQISAENENRLRRLLLNSERTAVPALPQDSLSNAQKAKKLKAMYEQLSCEGFNDDQIEQALSSIKDSATLEAALDWLCLNLPSDELPLKFSSGIPSYRDEGGSVNVILASRKIYTPLLDSPTKIREDGEEIFVRAKGQHQEDTLDSCQPSQADWIRQYLERQEGDDSRSWEDEAVDTDPSKEVPGKRSFDVIAQEYYAARSEASKAKEKGDKKRQEQAGHVIRKLKQELSALGLSDEILVSNIGREQTTNSSAEDTFAISLPYNHHKSRTLVNVESDLPLVLHSDESKREGNDMESWDSKEFQAKALLSTVTVEEKKASDDDVELGGLFFEDSVSNEALPSEVLKLQKKQKMRELYSEQNLERLNGIWKKGDPQKAPKAVLHQLCQRLLWDAPKFQKLVGKENNFFYSVSVLRKASGVGKSRKAGGLVTLQLPSQDRSFESVEDAQNAVASFALHRLFPELPIHLAIMEPYASLVLQWKEEEFSTKSEEVEEDRKSAFVDRLLNMDGTCSTISAGVTSSLLPETSQRPHVEARESSNSADHIAKSGNYNIEAECNFLRREQENKKKRAKYKDIFKIRASLPIAGSKYDILQSLKENDVLVVCGDTGSGKTTQVPQFILDDMIESGNGGYCNIICTQPRRIAAISVAERVAEERCEPPPGSDGSFVGYQVRLDSARNEKTKLLFCTTGILLRKLAGDKMLTGISHIIVDEVHERSLLGDFLLIILKNLIEKQSTYETPKLKVILMSATVDSSLFSRYFGHCPVITALGRTHPVTTYFLEDIYESINYHLPSDSPASLTSESSTRNMHGSVSNHRGKKNLVLSAWGDDSILLEDRVNPYYVPSNYRSYAEQTQLNLKRLNEDVIDYDLLEDLICHIDKTCEEGAILVFLPGMSEIYTLHDKLAASYQFGGSSVDWLFPLHSSTAARDQKKVFLRPPKNIRKVIIATNIAETSITIDDVVYVIDCGRHKENRYNPHKKLSSMVEDWISQANARQRRGRAGRVRPGLCFCLYTCHRFEKLMRPYQVPEMLRMPLVELCLQIKLLGLGHIKPFLSKALEPPREEAITSAISLLSEVGAIEGDEELTPLGQHLAKLPVDVLIGKMLLYGAIFGCLSPILSIAAFLSYKSPFVYPKDERPKVERAKLDLLTKKEDGSSDSNDWYKQSDHLLLAVAYMKWEKILREKGTRSAQQFCNSFFLSNSVMHMIRDMRVQFGTLVADSGLISLPKNYRDDRKGKEHLDSWFSDKLQPFNMYSHQPEIVKAILCSGLYPNIAATEQGITSAAIRSFRQSDSAAVKGYSVWYDGRREVHIHASSVNCNLKAFQHPFLVFLEKVETHKVFLRDTTIISPFCLLLFGGSISIQHQIGMVTIDGWLKLTAPAQTAVLFKELRLTLQSILNELIRKPKNIAIVDNEVVRSMVHLLLEEGKPPK